MSVPGGSPAVHPTGGITSTLQAILQFSDGGMESIAAPIPFDRADRAVDWGDLVFFAAGAVCNCHALYGLGRDVAIAMDFPPPDASCTSRVS